MRCRLQGLLSIVAFSFFGFVALGGLAQAGEKLGFEVELQARALQALTQYYDFEVLDREEVRRGLPAAMLRDYLLVPGNFESLPAEVQAELTQGLNLRPVSEVFAQSRVSAPEKESAPPASAEAPRPDALALPEQRRLLQPSEALELKPGEVVRGGIVITEAQDRTQDWARLNSRWNSLPLERQRQLARITRLPRIDLVQILLEGIQAPDAEHEWASMHFRAELKKDAPPLLRRLESSNFDGYLEYRHRDPVTSLSELLQDLREFSRLAGIERQIFRPGEGRRTDTSLHVHWSRDPLPPGTPSLEGHVIQLARLGLLRSLAEGEVDLLHGSIRSLPVAYRRDPSLKGITRLVASNRIELRVFFEDTVRELEEAGELLDLPQNEALERIRERAARLMTPAVTRLMLEPDEGDASGSIISDFLDLMVRANWKEEDYTKIFAKLHPNAIDFRVAWRTLLDNVPLPSQSELQARHRSVALKLLDSSPDNDVERRALALLWSRLYAPRGTALEGAERAALSDEKTVTRAAGYLNQVIGERSKKRNLFPDRVSRSLEMARDLLRQSPRPELVIGAFLDRLTFETVNKIKDLHRLGEFRIDRAAISKGILQNRYLEQPELYAELAKKAEELKLESPEAKLLIVVVKSGQEAATSSGCEAGFKTLTKMKGAKR